MNNGSEIAVGNTYITHTNDEIQILESFKHPNGQTLFVGVVTPSLENTPTRIGHVLIYNSNGAIYNHLTSPLNINFNKVDVIVKYSDHVVFDGGAIGEGEYVVSAIGAKQVLLINTKSGKRLHEKNLYDYGVGGKSHYFEFNLSKYIRENIVASRFVKVIPYSQIGKN